MGTRKSGAGSAVSQVFLSYAAKDAKYANKVHRAMQGAWQEEGYRQLQLAAENAISAWESSSAAEHFWRINLQRALDSRDSAAKRARRAIHDLSAGGHADAGTAERARTLVDVFFTPNTIYASIGPDDGGITFYWRAGDMSIEIDIYPREGYWWRVRNVAAENYTGHGRELPIDALKFSLNWFSKEVDRANSSWRNQTS